MSVTFGGNTHFLTLTEETSAMTHLGHFVWIYMQEITASMNYWVKGISLSQDTHNGDMLHRRYHSLGKQGYCMYLLHSIQPSRQPINVTACKENFAVN